jgi:hypothetical protein
MPRVNPTSPLPDPYHGVFAAARGQDGHLELRPHPAPPASLPDPRTGRALKIATVEANGPAICPVCAGRAHGGYISFVADLRLVYACPACRQLVWLHGA